MDLSGSPLQGVVDLTLQHHMNTLHGALADERDPVRVWRRRVRDLLAHKNEATLAFLEAPAAEWGGVKRHEDFLRTLTSPTFNPGSSWMSTHVVSLVDLSGLRVELDAEVGAPLESVSESLLRIMDLYQASIARLFTLNESIARNVAKLEELQMRLKGIGDLGADESAESAALQASVIAYIGRCYESYRIKDEYTAFCAEYARFRALRSVIHPHQVARDLRGVGAAAAAVAVGGPVCSICTTDRVTAALIPCGHTFCNSCAQKQRSVCYLCRCTVRDRQRLYFS
jgi:hypothetical protein